MASLFDLSPLQKAAGVAKRDAATPAEVAKAAPAAAKAAKPCPCCHEAVAKSDVREHVLDHAGRILLAR